MLKNEPPDKYKCIKVPLKKILKDENVMNTLVDAVEHTNKIVIKTYNACLNMRKIFNDYISKEKQAEKYSRF
jgi:hypothetical protein